MIEYIINKIDYVFFLFFILITGGILALWTSQFSHFNYLVVAGQT